MKVFIDGYNLMWTSKILNPIARFDFDLARGALEKLIRAYIEETNEDIMVVYDGYKGDFPYTRRENRNGLDIVVTGKGITADRWIMENVSNAKAVAKVVTSDGEIAGYSRNRGIAVTGSGAFEENLLRTLSHRKEILDEIHDLKRSYQKKQGRKSGKY